MFPHTGTWWQINTFVTAGKQETGMHFTHNFRNQKLLTVMYSLYEMSLLNSILQREGNQDMEINTTPVASIKFT